VSRLIFKHSKTLPRTLYGIGLIFIIIGIGIWALYTPIAPSQITNPPTPTPTPTAPSQITDPQVTKCQNVEDYKNRVHAGIDEYGKLKVALLKTIGMANYIEYRAGSKRFTEGNQVDSNFHEHEVTFSKLARLQSTYDQILACHSIKEKDQLSPYLYALTNLEIADNVIYLAYGAVVGSCNSNAKDYSPYFRAADAAVDIAKKNLAGEIKSTDQSEYIAQEKDYFTNMKAVKGRCNY
ncbi:MAG: hypothetical protein ACYCTW_11970, partial [Sulfuricella sp.]